MKVTILAALAVVPLLAMDNEATKRLGESASVFSEIMATPDKGIPQEMLENANCIVIVPGMKTAGPGKPQQRGFLLVLDGGEHNESERHQKDHAR